MSLILDALRKLEREKDAREPAVLVVGSVSWGETSHARRILLAVGAALVLGLAVVAGWLLRPTPEPAAARALPPAASPAPAPRPMLSAALPPSTLPSSTLPAAPTTTLPSAPPIRISRPLPLGPERPARAAGARPAAASLASTAVRAASEGPVALTLERPSLDPVAPAPAGAGGASAAAPPGELRLTAISQRDGRPVALINDRLLFEGDSFEGVRVLRIGDTEVEVEVRGQRRILKF